MDRVSSMNSLQSKIDELEALQLEQISELKNSAQALVKSVSPVQMIKTTLRDVMGTPGLRANAIDAAMGIGAGLLGKKLLISNSKNIFRKITGSALQFILTNFVSKKMHQTREHIIEKKENGLSHNGIS